MPRILVARGYAANPWELRPWELLPEDYEVSVLVPRGNSFDTSRVILNQISVTTRRSRWPSAPLKILSSYAFGDNFLLDQEFLDTFDVLHIAELSPWFSAGLLKKIRKRNMKVVCTVWETIPFLNAFRDPRARHNRAIVLNNVDLFLPTTQRAADSLVLEGVPESKIQVCAPGIDTQRFHRTPAPIDRHIILSPGRLVWEKGHQDVIRALACLHRGIVALPSNTEMPRLRLVGTGPERERLNQYAHELGIKTLVDFVDWVPYQEMPQQYAEASVMTLASLPLAAGQLHPFDIPRHFWEEQFGMVLFEGIASGLNVIASRSGAIPEVLQGHAQLFEPGDWRHLAALLSAGPLSRPPGERVNYPNDFVSHFSAEAAASRLSKIYASL